MLATAAYLRDKQQVKRLVIGGSGAGGVIAACVALRERDIVEVLLRDVPATFFDAGSPRLLGVLRSLDIPEVLGALAPRPLVIEGIEDEPARIVKAVFEAAKAGSKLRILPLEKRL